MTVLTTLTNFRGGMFKIKLTGTTSIANAGQGEVLNPFGIKVGITHAWMYARTGSTGAANLDVGVGASGAKASDICSAMSVVEADAGGDLTALPAARAAETDVPTAVWDADKYVTFTASADLTGFDGDFLLECIPLE